MNFKVLEKALNFTLPDTYEPCLIRFYTRARYILLGQSTVNSESPSMSTCIYTYVYSGILVERSVELGRLQVRFPCGHRKFSEFAKSLSRKYNLYYYKPTSGLSQILSSDWLSYSLSILNKPLVAKGINFQIQNNGRKRTFYRCFSLIL